MKYILKFILIYFIVTSCFAAQLPPSPFPYSPSIVIKANKEIARPLITAMPHFSLIWAQTPFCLYDVYTSTDLRSWSTLTNKINTNNITIVANSPNQFYFIKRYTYQTNGVLNLFWSAPVTDVPISGYNIHYGLTSNCPDAILNIQTTNYTLTNLLAGSNYFFYVTCTNLSEVESPPSIEISSIPDYIFTATNKVGAKLNLIQ